MTADEYYKRLCDYPSDINEHLPILKELASQCVHVVEFGFREGFSTMALICGQPEVLITYDNDEMCWITFGTLRLYAKEKNVQMSFVVDDTRNVICPKTDFLFIDTMHNSLTIVKELTLSGNRARKFFAFHDTESFGLKGELQEELGGGGIRKPIEEFMQTNPHWQVLHDFKNNNGLLVLERR